MSLIVGSFQIAWGSVYHSMSAAFVSLSLAPSLFSHWD